MGTKPLLIGCLLWIMALHVTSAQENNSIQFNSPASTAQTNLEERFKIPPVTQDVRYDPLISTWVADSVMNFAHDLGVALDQNEFPNTQIFSPLSVMSALSILDLGAAGNSHYQLNKLFQALATDPKPESWKTHEEFGWLLEDLILNRRNPKRPRHRAAWRKTPANPTAFGTGGKNTPNEHTIRVANGLFVQEGFSLRPDYKFAAQSVYKSEVMELDFRTRQDYAKHYINSWVNQNTLGKIPAIIADEVSRDTNLIIASAVYFKGFWDQPFLGSGTAEANFYPDGQSSEPVRVMMMGTGGVYPYYDSQEYNCHIIGLPYKGNQTTMYVIQPHDSTRRNLNDLQQFLTGDKINELISKMEQKTAVMAFPKFHATNTLHLKGPLSRMGIEDIFKNGLSDLSLIADAGVSLQQAAGPQLPVESPPLPQPRPSAFPVPQNVERQLGPTFSVQQSIERQPAPTFNVPENLERPAPVFLRPTAALPAQESQRAPVYQRQGQGPYDRYNEAPLIFSRFSEINTTRVPIVPSDGPRMQWSQQGDLLTGKVMPQPRSKRTVTYKVESEFMRSNLPLRLKDLILSKRITKPNPGKKVSRTRRQAIPDSAASLQNLDRIRFTPGLRKPQLYVDDVLHKVDFVVNEQGTEAAAATVTYLRRSGTDVAFRCDTPFLILVRHDPTRLPLFYGKVNIPMA